MAGGAPPRGAEGPPQDGSVAAPPRARGRRWGRLLAITAIVALALAVIGAVAIGPWLSGIASRRLVEAMERRFDSRVSIERLDVQLVPYPRASGDELTITPTTRPEEAPPLIRVRRFTVSAGYLGFFRSPIRVGHVDVDGAEIIILPDDEDDEERREASTAAPPKGEGEAETTEQGESAGYRVHVNRIDVRDIQLRLVPRKAHKSDRVFDIAHVSLRPVRRDAPLEYEATLVNPLPRGNIIAAGSFGPWSADDPGETPVSGRFTFTGADLGTIDGLRGTLEADGEFTGHLERIAVRGRTRTPEFGLTISDQVLPLDTTFAATVDGTNGDTLLHDVQARLGQTPISVSGAVTDDEKGLKGRQVKVSAKVSRGRIEDLLRLAMKGATPAMRGEVAMDTRVFIPAGKGDVVRKIQIDAKVSIAQARFTENRVQRKLNEFSARASGEAERAKDAAAGPAVASALTANATVRDGTVRLAPVTFRIDGAVVRLDGTYGLESEAIDLRGAATLDAKLSQTTTGWKSWLLKLADPLFRRKGQSVLPISVSGTAEDPKVGLDVKRALLRR